MVASPNITTERTDGARSQTLTNVVRFGTEVPLSETEEKALSRCESVIAKHITRFFEVGRALMGIQKGRLYRREFKTFEEYCRQRWDISRVHAYRHIQGAEVMNNLLPMGNIPLPQNERQVRPMFGLPAKMLRKVWREVVRDSASNRITERLVRERVREMRAPKAINAAPERETWQRLVEPLLKKAVKATNAGDRESVRDVLNRMALLLDIGNHPRPLDLEEK